MGEGPPLIDESAEDSFCNFLWHSRRDKGEECFLWGIREDPLVISCAISSSSSSLPQQANFKIQAARLHYEIYALTQRLRMGTLRAEHEQQVRVGICIKELVCYLYLHIVQNTNVLTRGPLKRERKIPAPLSSSAASMGFPFLSSSSSLPRSFSVLLPISALRARQTGISFVRPSPSGGEGGTCL